MTTFVKRLDFPMDGQPVAVLVGADKESAERIAKCKRDAVYRIEPKRDNNARHHRMVMRLLRDLFEAQEEYESEEAHRVAVKLAIGWIEDEVVITPPSERRKKAAAWCRENRGRVEPGIMDAIADLLEDPVTQYVTRSLSFEKCDQSEREDFWRRLKDYAAPILGHAHVESYERL